MRCGSSGWAAGARSAARSNTATGLVFVNAGTLALGKSAGLKAVGGNITVGDDSGGNSVDVLRLDSSDQIPDSRSFTGLITFQRVAAGELCKSTRHYGFDVFVRAIDH